jgi:hypothetical protein
MRAQASSLIIDEYIWWRDTTASLSICFGSATAVLATNRTILFARRRWWWWRLGRKAKMMVVGLLSHNLQ